MTKMKKPISQFDRVMHNGMFTSPYQKAPGKNRQRWYQLADTNVSITGYNRRNMVSLSRDIYTTFPIVNAAINIKNDWCFSNGYVPIYDGKNKKWGDTAESWLISWFNVCNANGVMDFITTIKLLSKEIDVSGDCLVIMVQGSGGFPLIQTISTNRIGQREIFGHTIESGAYMGYKMYDGVIVNDQMRPVGYNILGDTKEEDRIIPSSQCKLVYDPIFSDNTTRGLPVCSSAIQDILNQQDTEYALQRTVQAESFINLLCTNERGGPDPLTIPSSTDYNNTSTSDTSTVASTGEVIPQTPIPEYLGQEGFIQYLKANAGEKLESFQTNRPSDQTQTFLDRIEKRVLASLGVPHEFIINDQGSAATRLVIDNFRNVIRNRQRIIDQVARWIIIRAVNIAQKNKYIPMNEDDFYSWKFSHPKLPTIDSGNDRAANINDMKTGLKSMQSIVGESGEYWEDVQLQRYKETEGWLSKSNELKNKYNLSSLKEAMDYLCVLYPNGFPQATDQKNEPAQ